MTGVLDVPFLAVADVLFPKNAEAMASSGIATVKYYFERMVGTLTALIMPAGLCIFLVPGLMIRIIAGADYLPAVPILQVSMFFSFLRPFYTQFGYTMDSIGKPQVNFWTNAVFLVISLGSTYLSIAWFGGLMGAVYAATFTMISGCIVFYVILRKHLKIELGSIVRYSLEAYAHLFAFMKKVLRREF
jgi:lipopolysaccharide exporter